MARRTHKKSRAGCLQCKRRHLKCDETRPKCVNCVTASLKCPYEDELKKSSSPGSRTISQAPSPSPKGQLDNSTPDESFSFNSPHPDNAASITVSMIHMELILHWTHHTRHTFTFSTAQEHVFGELLNQIALKHPFLMLQVLAISALHLSILRPDRKQYYHDHSTRLQAEALEGFNKVVRDIDSTNVVPAFLFSMLVGVHVFGATFAFRGDDFNEVLESLASCINLLRGVRSIIHGQWEVLQESELRPILVTAHDMRTAASENPKEMSSLLNLISTADIGETSRAAYKQAIEEMELIYQVQKSSSADDTNQRANMVLGWFVQVQKEYVDLLMQRRPEALLILAHFAAILHMRKDFWAVGDAGRYIVGTVNNYLGKHWESSLAWPNAMVAALSPQ